jgi:Inhibitor of apoptosis-promoting Bax1
MSYVETTPEPVLARDESRTLFGQTMGLVAVTAGLFALGAYLGRDLSYGWRLIAFLASFGLLIGLHFAVSRSEQLAIGMLFGFGVLIGVGTAPTIAYYASTNPQSVWQAGAATALFIAGFGAAGYATRRDLSGVARVLLGAARADRLRDRGHLREHPEQRADLLDRRPRDLRRVHDVRLPAPEADAGHPRRSVARRLDLPRHPQRLPAPAIALQPTLAS